MQMNILEKGTTKKAPGKEVIIIKNGGEALNKKQKEFNKLVGKVEILRKKLEDNTLLLDTHLKYYGEFLKPMEVELGASQLKYIKLLLPYIANKKLLTKREKDALKNYLSLTVKEILTLLDDEPTDELKEIYEIINGSGFDKDMEDEFERMKEGLGDMMKSMGVDVDLEGINKGMSEEEVAEKVAEMEQEHHRLEDKKEQEQAARKKTKKEIEKELKEKKLEEARKKNISSIYRQLAKLIHPDLEIDPEIKLQKEETMKRLTVAYEENDLLTLLKMEIEWMQKEEKDALKLSDEKLAIYNEVLKEQVAGLEEKMYMMEQHPRYMPLHRFSDIGELLKLKSLAPKKNELQNIISATKHNTRSVESSNGPKMVKEIAKEQVFEQESARNFDGFDEAIAAFMRNWR